MLGEFLKGMRPFLLSMTDSGWLSMQPMFSVMGSVLYGNELLQKYTNSLFNASPLKNVFLYVSITAAATKTPWPVISISVTLLFLLCK